MRLLRRHHLLPALVAALLVAGCGGGGGGGGDGGEESDAYKAGAEVCAPGVKEIAAQYAVAAKPEAVADAVAEALSGGVPQHYDAARQGCLDALEKAEK